MTISEIFRERSWGTEQLWLANKTIGVDGLRSQVYNVRIT